MVMRMKEKALYALAAVSLLAMALPVIAQTPPPPPGRTAQTVDVACIQAAIDKRDNAIITAVDTFHDAAKSALQTRRDALKAAWGNTDRDVRRAAIKAAWESYRNSLRSARKALRESRRSAWSQFAADRKACGRGAQADDRTGGGADAQL